jgi:hypothetical protein
MRSGRWVVASVIPVMVVLCGAWNVVGAAGRLAAQGAPAAPGQGVKGETPMCGADVARSLAGSWKAPQYKMKRGGDTGTEVFGANAFDVRDVELTLDGSGNGTLKITTSVLDQKGKTWAPTLVEAKIAVGAATPANAGRCDIAVTVAGAEERYLDQTQYQAPIEGAQVMMLFDPATRQLDVRFQTPKGPGSFWTTVRRPAAAH